MSCIDLKVITLRLYEEMSDNRSSYGSGESAPGALGCGLVCLGAVCEAAERQFEGRLSAGCRGELGKSTPSGPAIGSVQYLSVWIGVATDHLAPFAPQMPMSRLMLASWRPQR